MTRTLYLHIGAPKAGSSTIQRFLKANRQALAARAWLYPEALGDPVRELILYALGDESDDPMRRRSGIGGAARLADMRRDVAAKLAAEIDAAGAVSIVLSHENLFNRLQRIDEVERLRDLLAPLCDRVVVIAYLRRQDEMVISRYCMAIRNGGCEPFEFRSPIAPADAFFDYELAISRWSEVFGEDNIRVRRFGRSYFTDGDLLADFMATIGLEPDGLKIIGPANEAPEVRRLEFLRLLNRALGDQARDPYWSDIRRALYKPDPDAPGRRFGASAEARADFCRQFDASNRAVAARYLGLDGGLFDHPFADDAPGEADRLDPETAVALSIRLIDRARKRS